MDVGSGRWRTWSVGWLQTPTGFNDKAQGKRSAALGTDANHHPTPQGLYKGSPAAQILAEVHRGYETPAGFGILG